MSSEFATKWRQLRACARCHRLKMRCSYDDPSHSACKRCFAMGVPCSQEEDPTANTRKRRKMTDPMALIGDSIEKLYENISALQAGSQSASSKHSSEMTEKLLKYRSQLNDINALFEKMITKSDSSPQFFFQETNFVHDTTMTPSSSQTSFSSSQSTSSLRTDLPVISYESNIMKQLINLTILNDEQSRERYSQFTTELLPLWPVISIPVAYDYDFLFTNQPLLLLTCIMVASINEPNLYEVLLYYLQKILNNKVFFDQSSNNLDTELVIIYIILSTWSVPPQKWGTFNHQLNLMMAHNLSLCLDLGNFRKIDGVKVIEDSSSERMNVRTFLTVYVCFGSLGLSLPNFKLVNWTKRHEFCYNILTADSDTEANNDKFISFASKMVLNGHNLVDTLKPMVQSCDNPALIPNFFEVIKSYESNFYLSSFGYLDEDSATKGSLTLMINSILIHVYDMIIVKFYNDKILTDQFNLLFLNNIILKCDLVINSFNKLLTTHRFIPTFFYYRPMNALILLIRVNLLVRSFGLPLKININEHLKSLNENLLKNSRISIKMSTIFTKIEKWVLFTNNFNRRTSLVSLLDEIGKESNEIELKQVSVVNDVDGNAEIESIVGNSAKKKNRRSQVSAPREALPKTKSLASFSLEDEPILISSSLDESISADLFPLANNIPIPNPTSLALQEPTPVLSDIVDPTRQTITDTSFNYQDNIEQSLKEIFQNIDDDLSVYFNPQMSDEMNGLFNF